MRTEKTQAHDSTVRTSQICSEPSSSDYVAIVLSDGKPGHFNQSLGVIQQIPECRCEFLEIAFRSKWRDNVLRVLMRIFGRFQLPHWFINCLLHTALQRKVLNQLDAIDYADLILSTGSSVAAVNLLLGQRLSAKTVTCRRPSPLGISHFDLVILPKMYWPRRDKGNICKTLGVPNRISPENLAARRRQHLENSNFVGSAVNDPNYRRIGVLLGGEDRYARISNDTAIHLIEALCRIAETHDCQILLATSRRTPIAVENLIGARLSNSQFCPILVLAHRENGLVDPVNQILALSDLVVVTEDSFSMVCEAASSGRQVIVLEVDRKTRRYPKRHRVYPEIMRRTSVGWSNTKNLEKTIAQALANSTPIEPLRDTQTAAAAIQRLFDETTTNNCSFTHSF